jgi:hypothetical protein
VLFKREMIAPVWPSLQPYLFGFSMYFFCLVMMGAVPWACRAATGTWPSAATPWPEWPGAAYLMMGLVGISGVAAIAGGAIYIYVTVGSLLWGKKLDAGVTSPKFTPDAVRPRPPPRRPTARLASWPLAPSCWPCSSWSPSCCTTSSTGSTSASCGV